MVETPGRITLWGIEVFIATADESSITAAARRLRASPSSVSQQISNLEGALGVKLLNRSARPVTLTPAGELFRRRAQTILNEAEQARAELALEDMSRLTRFRLGMIEDFDADVTPALLANLSRDLSTTQFLLETGASHRLFDQLDARALDVIVAADMGGDEEWMELHPLLEEPFVAAVPRGVLEPGRDVLEQLSALPLIQYTARHHMGRQIAAHLVRENLRLDHRFELDSYHSIMAMVATGVGWTILTPLGFLRAHRFRAAAELVQLPFAPLSRRISLIARRDVLGDIPARTAARLRPLIADEIIKPCLAEMPWLGGALRLL